MGKCSCLAGSRESTGSLSFRLDASHPIVRLLSLRSFSYTVPSPPPSLCFSLGLGRGVGRTQFLSCAAAAAATKSLQSCPTLCDPTDGSPPGPSVHGSFQTRALEWGVPLPSPADHTSAHHIVHLRRAFCSVSNIFHLKVKKKREKSLDGH